MKNQDRYLPHIIFAMIIAILPHLGRLPVWIIVWCTTMWGYLLFSLRFQWPRPNRAVLILLSVFGLTGLLATYGTRTGPNAYLGLLSVMAALKPFEISTHRDRMITLFLAYFIVITSLFQSESLSMTLYMFLSVFVTTGTLILINDGKANFKSGLRLSGIIMAQAIPLMVILFLLFPRIQGRIFGLSGATDATSGFSERLNPGNISRLGKNNDIVFRADFEARIPPAESLYWRGIVFHEFDGRSWHRLNRMPGIRNFPKGKERVAYSIALEPHGKRWLFTLDRPASKPKWTLMHMDYTLRNLRPVNRKKYYRMVSFLRPYKGSLRDVEAPRQLPAKGNPKSRQLAARFAENAGSVDEIIDRIMTYLRTREFIYTLRPPLLNRDSIDDFLFRSGKGYCEHYASAFAFLMRAAGVPARIVGGYLGGEVNPFGNYLMVRQSDAHVWVEVWARENGWMRVDPTFAVAPERITEGAGGMLRESKFSGGLFGKWVNQLRFGWDAVSSGWEAWFSGYSFVEQRALIERLGISMRSWKGLLSVLLLAFGMIFLIVGLCVFFQVKPLVTKKDRIRLCYEKFCKKLKKIGCSRPLNQGPVDFAAYVARERPDLKPSVDEMMRLYVRLRYQKDHDVSLVKHFCKRVKEFNPLP